jgi:preprotein translocase subunit SecG
MQEKLIVSPVEQGHSVIIFVCLALVCLLYVFIFSFYQEQSKRLLTASVNSKAKNLVSRIDSETINKVGRYMNVLFFFNLLLFVYGTMYKYQVFNDFTKLQIFVFLIAVLALFLLKYFAHCFLGFLFKTQDLTKQYIEELYLKYKLFGVLLFPLVLLLLFSNSFAGIAVAIGVSTYVVFWITGTYFALTLGLMSRSLPKYYPFLYICTLEILPLALVWKIFQAPLTGLLGL